MQYGRYKKPSDEKKTYLRRLGVGPLLRQHLLHHGNDVHLIQQSHHPSGNTAKAKKGDNRMNLVVNDASIAAKQRN